MIHCQTSAPSIRSIPDLGNNVAWLPGKVGRRPICQGAVRTKMVIVIVDRLLHTLMRTASVWIASGCISAELRGLDESPRFPKGLKCGRRGIAPGERRGLRRGGRA